MKKIIKDYGATLAIIIVVVLINLFVISPVKVSGSSMAPTLSDEQYMYQLKMEKIKRLDIVTFHAPDEGKVYIKRVIGLPGDVIEYHKGDMSVNGQKLTEDYILEASAEEYHVTVPEDHYFVLGDNRNDSTDSRIIGCVPKSSIIGIAHAIEL